MESKGFKIPEDYFHHKNKELLAISEEKSRPKLRSLSFGVIAAAASMILALFLWPQDQVTPITNLPTENLSAYLIEQEELFTHYPQHRLELYSLGDSLNLEKLDSNLILDYLDESLYLDTYESFTL